MFIISDLGLEGAFYFGAICEKLPVNFLMLDLGLFQVNQMERSGKLQIVD